MNFVNGSGIAANQTDGLSIPKNVVSLRKKIYAQHPRKTQKHKNQRWNINQYEYSEK